MECDQVIDGAHGRIRRSEEREFVAGVVDDRIKVVGRDDSVAEHEWKIPVHLGQ
jgi:hypothetical protein